MIKKLVLKAFFNTITLLFIINSNNKELMHHIHCLRYIFYHQSMKTEFCWFHRFLFCDFRFYLSNVANIHSWTEHFCIIITYCWNNIFFIPFSFLFLLLSFTKRKYIFGFKPKKFHNSSTSCFTFINHYFVWHILIFLRNRIVIRTKHFFILTKIIINIFGFMFKHQTISISE